MPGNLSKMTKDEKDAITSQIKTDAEKAVENSTAEVELTQDSARRRRASHTGSSTFSATVTVTFPAGTTLKAAKDAVEAQPKAKLTYTVGGELKEFTVDYAVVAKTVKDVTPEPALPPTLTEAEKKTKANTAAPTAPASSAATVLSTVAMVLVATVAALF
jgi:hypothetical protein